MSTPDPNTATICQQRAARMYMTPPLARVSLISPYATPSPYNSPQNTVYKNTPFTQFQLNMRRKVEILKYSSNTQSTQTNNQTKLQRWSQIARGANQKQFSYNPITGVAILNDCSQNNQIPTLSTGSNVPGPPIYLYEDPAVPLYNYAFNTRSNPNDIQTSTDPWYTRIYADQVLAQDTSGMVVSICITQYISGPYMSIPINVPLSIHLYGALATNQSKQPLEISVNTINVAVMYSSTPIQQIQYNSTSQSIAGLSTLTWNMTSNLNKSNQFNITKDIGVFTFTLNPTSTSRDIPTTNGAVYDIMLQVHLSVLTVSSQQTPIFATETSFLYETVANASLPNQTVLRG